MELKLKNEDLKSLSQCANSLKKQGFEKEFQVVENGLKAIDDARVYTPEEVKIIDHYKFEDECDPADMSVLNVIETNTGLKGTLVAIAGPYANGKVANFIGRVKDIYRRRIKMKIFHEKKGNYEIENECDWGVLSI